MLQKNTNPIIFCYFRMSLHVSYGQLVQFSLATAQESINQSINQSIIAQFNKSIIDNCELKSNDSANDIYFGDIVTYNMLQLNTGDFMKKVPLELPVCTRDR